MRSFGEDKFLRFFALHMTIGPKIPGAVIPRRVFTQPGSKREAALFGLMSAPAGCGHEGDPFVQERDAQGTWLSPSQGLRGSSGPSRYHSSFVGLMGWTS